MKNFFSSEKFLYLSYIAIAILGVWYLSGLWLPSGYALGGHDSGLALNAKDFLFSRFYAWRSQGFGQDNSPHFGSLIIHSIDYVTSFLSGELYAGNRLNIFFWFSVLFSSSFLFAYKLKDRLGKFSLFLFPAFIVVNFYVLQSVFILERAKYSIFAASLLFLLIAIKIVDGKVKPLLGAILSSFILFLFNSGSWLGIPLYGGFIILILSYLLSELLWGIKEKSLLKFWKLILFLALTIIGFIILNCYSILPYLSTFVSQDYSSLVSGSVISQNKEWLRALSQASSFLNFFRLQGIPDWYSGAYGINSTNPFADIYLSNKYLIAVSFVFPLVSFSSFLLAKTREQKKLISMLGISVLLSMFFMAGSHKPLGFIYELIFDYFPGFAIFRSPYFKFGSAFYLGISGMMAFTFSSLIERLESRLRIKNIFIGFVISLLIMAFWLFYHYIIFSPEKIFGWQTGYSTKLSTPQYIEEFRDWAAKNNLGDGRILLAPPLNNNWKNDAYTWGYWSLTSLPEDLGIPNVLSNNSTLSNQEREWVNRLYEMITNENEEEFINLSSRLGVEYLLLRKDVLADASWSSARMPGGFELALSSFREVVPMKTFGEWTLYRINVNSSRFLVGSSLVLISDKQEYLARELVENGFAFVGSPDQGLTPFISEKLSVIECESCLLERKPSIDSLPKVRILPNSPLYYFKARREKALLNAAVTDQSKIDTYLGFVLTRSAEIKTMLDFNIDEKDIVASLEITTAYVENLNELAKDFPDGRINYFLAKRILDFIVPMEISFKKYVSTQAFNEKGEKLRQVIYSLLWQIYNIRKTYAPLSIAPDILETKKTYYPAFEEPGEYDLFIKTSSLSRTATGDYLNLLSIALNKDNIGTILPLKAEKDDWLKYKLEVKNAGTAVLDLIFQSNRNLLINVKAGLEPLPTDERACYVGNIAYFNPFSKYLVSVSVSEKNQYLKLFIKEGFDNSPGSNFLHGENEAEIYPILTYEPFRYLYYPAGYAKEPKIYLCSGNKELPKIDNIEVREIISPLVVISKVNELEKFELPELKFKEVNPTKYIISINNAKEPFILIFKEHYNQFWKITTPESVGDEHFMVDGYANGWKITKTGSYDLVIEYQIQKLFYVGIGITLAGLLGVSVYLGYKILWRKEKLFD